jgi:hypothetical protein
MIIVCRLFTNKAQPLDTAPGICSASQSRLTDRRSKQEDPIHMANDGISALGRTFLRPFPKLRARLRRLRNAYRESGRPPHKPTATVDFEHASGERRLDPFHLEEMISDVVESDRRIEIAD